MDEDAIVFLIPMIAIVCATIYKLVKLYFHHELEKSKLSSRPSASMEKRMAELENRILTLQDLVIGGEYEARRRLEHAVAQHEAVIPPPPADMNTVPSQPVSRIQQTR